jgi:hypothetical protein
MTWIHRSLKCSNPQFALLYGKNLYGFLGGVYQEAFIENTVHEIVKNTSIMALQNCEEQFS